MTITQAQYKKLKDLKRYAAELQTTLRQVAARASEITGEQGFGLTWDLIHGAHVGVERTLEELGITVEG